MLPQQQTKKRFETGISSIVTTGDPAAAETLQRENSTSSVKPRRLSFVSCDAQPIESKKVGAPPVVPRYPFGKGCP